MIEHPNQTIRRHDNGSVDVEYYLARGRAARSAEIRSLARRGADGLSRLIRGVAGRRAPGIRVARPLEARV